MHADGDHHDECVCHLKLELVNKAVQMRLKVLPAVV